MNITKDHQKIIAILNNKDNEQKHMNSVVECLFLFKHKWYIHAKSTQDVLLYSQYCLEQDTEYEILKQKLYGDNKSEL
jgi:hypothetical protein